MNCHNCKSQNLDEGFLPDSNLLHPVCYRSSKQKGMSQATILEAKVCLDCGYVHLFLDPKELKKRIQ